MIEKRYEALQETLAIDTLPNGLTVYYLPKPDYHKTYGLFTTNFGSLDVTFTTDKKPLKTYPEGIAHFLEHKLFEKADGDVMYKFGSLGAQTNAFTSFNRTAYLFYSSEKIKENISLLLDFVQIPYFTAENVLKEQGIITQEIQMYQDDPDWRLFSGILAALYPDSPLASDIAGTPTSISQITADMLYENHQAFYQPTNMTLFLTGPFDVKKLSELVTANQAAKSFAFPQTIERAAFSPSAAVAASEISMAIALPKLALGFRGEDRVEERNLYSYRLTLQLFFAMIFGKTSHFYETAYAEGLIDDSFGYEFEMDANGRFHCLLVSLDTKIPEKLAETLQKTLKSYKINGDVTAQHLNVIKRQTLGAHLSSLNSLEFIANEFAAMPITADKTLFDLPEVLSALTIEDIEQTADQFLATMQCSRYVIRPKS